MTWLLVVVVSAAALGGCGGTPDPDGSRPPLSLAPTKDAAVLLDFEGGSTAADPSAFPDHGRLGGVAVVRTLHGGRVRLVAGQDGGKAVRFPAYDTSRPPQRAVLVLRPAAGESRLDPGERDFAFGADFRLDGVSEGEADDNGNNLVQRGLVAGPAQYKLQVEHGRASCRVTGSRGDVLVSSTSVVQPEEWYTLTCARRADEVTLTLRCGRQGRTERVSSEAATGSLTYPARTPLVIGGKVSPTGVVVNRNSDQFNGAVDNVFMRTG